ncbi:MAG: hypothetical protein KF729_15920 [Sandaracinaceae bacterium]|nr:hypothetical protein [Sandaracinaceae bacterium]
MSERAEGGGCLKASLAIGVLMVVAALAIEMMPERFELAELFDPGPTDPYADEAPAPYVYEAPTPPPHTQHPDAPAPYYAPEAPAAEPPLEDLLDEPLVEDVVAPDDEPGDDAPGNVLVWHVEAPGTPPVACVLYVTVPGDDDAPRGPIGLACADGRSFEGDADGGELTDVELTAGIASRLVLQPLEGRDRAGRPTRLAVDTGRHELSLGDVRMFVEELSVPEAPEERGTPSAVSEPILRLAVPTEVSGPIPDAIAIVRGTGRAPRARDPVCELTAGPAVSSTFSCRVLLRCRGELIYGAGTSGYNRCVVRGGAVVTANDGGSSRVDTDPRLELDLDRNHLVVSDEGDRGEWSVTFQLLADPRVGPDVTYDGRFRAADGRSGRFTLRPFGSPPVLAFDQAREPLAATAGRFGSGEYAILRESGRVHLAFGRGGRAIAGALEGRAVWGFAPRGR